MVQGALDSVQAASALNEAMSKSDAVFGAGSASMKRWAAGAADAFGQSKRQALEAAGTFGNLLQAFGIGAPKAQAMSKAMTELASDLASFNNTSVDEAIQALRSGLSGETEPLKRYGVAISDARMRIELMSQGVTKLGSTLTPLQKTTAAYSLILKDTTLAQGDFKRTADGLANTQKTVAAQMEDASAEIGDKLLPLALKLANAFKDNVIPALSGFASVLGVVSGDGLPKTADGVSDLLKLAGMFSPVAREAAQALDESMAAMRSSTDRVVSGVAAKNSEYRQVAREFAEGLPDEMDDARKEAVRIANRTPQEIADGLREGRDEWQDAVGQLADDLKNPMSSAAEFAKIKGELVGKNLARGLKSSNPVARAQARATRQILLDRLEDMGGDASKWGKKFTENLAAGIRSRIETLQRALRLLAKTQADYLQYQSPAKVGPGSEGGGPEGWARKFVESYAKGMDPAKVASASSRIAGASIPRGIAGGRPGFGGPVAAFDDPGSGRPITVVLQVDGREVARAMFDRSGRPTLTPA